jgi:hypothetical protein
MGATNEDSELNYRIKYQIAVLSSRCTRPMIIVGYFPSIPLEGGLWTASKKMI